MVGRIGRFNESCTCIHHAVVVRTPVVATRFVQQVDVLGAGKHFAPAHATDVSIHTADAVVVIPSRELRSHALHYEDRFRIVLRYDGVVLHELFAGQQLIAARIDYLVGIIHSQLSILRVGVLVRAAHIEIDSGEHSLGSTLRSVSRALVNRHQFFSFLQVADSLFVGLLHRGTILQIEVTHHILRRTVDDGHTQILRRSLVIGTTISTHKVEVHQTADVVAFTQLVVDFSILSLLNHVDDVRSLSHSFVAIVPEVLQTIVLGGTRVRDEFKESIG